MDPDERGEGPAGTISTLRYPALRRVADKNRTSRRPAGFHFHSRSSVSHWEATAFTRP